jgi:hypothetical protein
VQLHAKAREMNGVIEWSLDFANPPATGSKAEVRLGKGSGPHDIVFHLSATHGLNISFDNQNPIWVSEGTQCPPSPGVNSDQIEILDVAHRKLRIRDSNSRECTLIYQLNFIGAEPLDPRIRNGGR